MATTLVDSLRNVIANVGSLRYLGKNCIYSDARTVIGGFDNIIVVGVDIVLRQLYYLSHLHQVLVGALAYVTAIVFINPVVLQVVAQGYILFRKSLRLV